MIVIAVYMKNLIRGVAPRPSRLNFGSSGGSWSFFDDAGVGLLANDLDRVALCLGLTVSDGMG